jgi:hypothetical protein
MLRHSFEVTLLHDFVFDLADGEWVELRPGHGFFTERVVGWHIEAAGASAVKGKMLGQNSQ